ncbi:hypothetical protein [Streptomyces cremeus]|uniref:Uncharacterized protein n=1 Tax=Streptomyces cremeus TaxID=66881 RepID=A0ABV5PH62_STRCM
MQNTAKSRARFRRPLAFGTGLAVSLAVFAFAPGLPGVIDAGALVVSAGAGALAAWVCGRRFGPDR